MYALSALFLFSPLYFSHILAPFGIVFGDGSSFERQKGYFIALCLFFALGEFFMKKGGVWFKQYKNTMKKWGLFLLFPLVGLLFTLDRDIVLYFIGSSEKNHGYIWFICGGILAGLLATLRKNERDILGKMSIIGALIVSLFAILEYLHGGSLFFESLGSHVWGERRSISTLGNPNYVAGYLLLHTPLLLRFQGFLRLGGLVVISLGILTTGSYFGLILLSFWIFYTVLGYLGFPRKRGLLVVGITAVTSLFFMSSYIGTEKLLSFESRGILMEEVITTAFSYPLYSLIGFGPESILSHFEGNRSEIINSYFPSSSAIDSSHNIFLDFFFQYGIIMGFVLLNFLSRQFMRLEGTTQEGVVLGLLFLSLNVTISLHVITLLLLFQDAKDES